MTLTLVKISDAVRALAVVSGLTFLAACTGGSGDGDTTGGTSSTSSPSTTPRTLTVFAAASLQKTFETIGKDFEAGHPGVTVRFNFGGSSGLVAQLTDGAPGDVLATANEATMTKAQGASLLKGAPSVFATNTLEIAVPRGNPDDLTDVAGLTDPGLKVVLCAPEVPCGAAAAAVEKAAGIDIKPVSEEQSVTDVLGKVRSGEADAGLVYTTDIIGAGDEVDGIAFPTAAAAINRYPIATLKGAEDSTLADEFVNAVLGTEGEEVLSAAGFVIPPPE